MKILKKTIIIIMITCCFGSIGYAQNYRTAAGARLGYFNGFTIKHFVSEKSAFEGLISSRWRGLELTGLYEIHNRAFHTEQLKWYIGFGGHVGFWNGEYAKWGDEGKSYTVVGIDGILGIEYSFREVPINIGLDWKPSFNIIGYRGFWGDGGALSIRYMF